MDKNEIMIITDKDVETKYNNLDLSIKESGAVIIKDSLPTILADRIQFIRLFLDFILKAINKW